MNLKLIDTIDVYNDKGIFQHLYDTGKLSFLTSDDAKNLDYDYYLRHSGDKNISLFYERLYTKYLDNQLVLNQVALSVLLSYADKWIKLYNVLNSDYNPIENYSMEETETPDITKNRTIASNTDTQTTTNNTNKVYGFNSSTGVPQSSNSGDSRVTGDIKNNTTTDNERETGSRTLTRSGNIGVTTSQQMIESELKLREYNFKNTMFNDIDSIMTRGIYD